MFDRIVTAEQAAESALRLINSHFKNANQARCSIPVNENDDDVVVMDYIRQSQSQLNALRPVPVDQVPEEWKDKRWLWLWGPCGPVGMMPTGYGYYDDLGPIVSFGAKLYTHVSLPLPPAEVPK